MEESPSRGQQRNPSQRMQWSDPTARSIPTARFNPTAKYTLIARSNPRALDGIYGSSCGAESFVVASIDQIVIWYLISTNPGSFKQRSRQIKLLMNMPLKRIPVLRRFKSRWILHLRRIRLYLNRNLQLLVSGCARATFLVLANRFVFTAVINTYRAVVHQSHIHHGLKDAVFNSVFAVERADLRDETVVEFFSFGGGGGFVEVGFIAFLCSR